MEAKYDFNEAARSDADGIANGVPFSSSEVTACAVCGYRNPVGTVICEYCSNDIPSDTELLLRLKQQAEAPALSNSGSKKERRSAESHAVRETDDARELLFDPEKEDPHPMSHREERMLRNLSLGKRVKYLPPHAAYATHKRRLSRALEAEANALRMDKYICGILSELATAYNEMYRWFRTTHGASYLYEAVRMADTQMRLESDLMAAIHVAAPYGTADAVGDYLLYRYAKGHAFCLDFRRKNAALLPAIRIQYENGNADFIKRQNKTNT